MTYSPCLGEWVIVKHCELERGSRARRQNANNTPALVTALNIMDGSGQFQGASRLKLPDQVTVIYPNTLVLTHGFGGTPLKRITVGTDCVRPVKETTIDVKRVEKQLLAAVRAVAIPMGKPGNEKLGREKVHDRSRSPSRQQNDIGGFGSTVLADSISAGVVEPLVAAHRAESYTPESLVASHPAEPCTPEPKPRSRELYRDDSDAKEPRMDQAENGSKQMAACKDIDDCAERWREFVSFVAKKFQSQSCDYLVKTELVSHLETSFTPGEVERGLHRLDAQNKIYLVDGLAFRV